MVWDRTVLLLTGSSIQWKPRILQTEAVKKKIAKEEKREKGKHKEYQKVYVDTRHAQDKLRKKR